MIAYHSGRISDTVRICGRVVTTNSLKITQSACVSRPQEGCRATTYTNRKWSARSSSRNETANVPGYLWQLYNSPSPLLYVRPAWKSHRQAPAARSATASSRLASRQAQLQTVPSCVEVAHEHYRLEPMHERKGNLPRSSSCRTCLWNYQLASVDDVIENWRNHFEYNCCRRWGVSGGHRQGQWAEPLRHLPPSACD